MLARLQNACRIGCLVVCNCILPTVARYYLFLVELKDAWDVPDKIAAKVEGEHTPVASACCQAHLLLLGAYGCVGDPGVGHLRACISLQDSLSHCPRPRA